MRAVQITHRIPSVTDKMESMRVVKWDGLGYICKHKILIVMYKFQHSMIANAIYDQFKDRLFQSRDGCSFNHPRVHREIGRTSITYRGTLLWNALSIESRNSVCLQQFKKMIQNEKTTIKSQSIEKEVCMIKNKKKEFL